MNTKMLKKSAMAMAVAAVCGMSGQALATGTILFDRNGTGPGGPIMVDAFNWSGDNVLLQGLVNDAISALGGVVISQSQTFSTFTLRMQSQLSNFTSDTSANSGAANCPVQDVGTQTSTCNVLSGEFTFQLTVPMIVTTAPVTGTSTTINFVGNGAANSDIGSFAIYYDPLTGGTASANNTTGNGYGDGTQILTGKVVVDSNTNGNFTMNSGNSLVKLDSNGTDQASGFGTYSGVNGSVQFDLQVLTQDFNYFVSDLRNTVIPVGMNLTSSAGLPFQNVNPTTTSPGVVGVVPNYGSNQVTGTFTGGTGGPSVSTRTMDDLVCGSSDPANVITETAVCDVLLQGQGQDSFFNPTNVPEPGSVALLGLGLGALGWLGRRRRDQGAQRS